MDLEDARYNRAFTDKLFLVESYEATEEFKRVYDIMGSTGNVYKVIITKLPTCTCPDHVTRKNRCKHIYFVLKRIMNAQDYIKKEYVEEELTNMFKNIPKIAQYDRIDEMTKNKYDKLKNKDSMVQAKRLDDDICPICLDEFDLTDEQPLDYCKWTCGKWVHTACLDMFKNKGNYKCPYCRTDWEQQAKQYINLK